MTATERYQVNIFAIVVLIAAVLIIVFLIITAVYFSGLMNLKPPAIGESTFLFWTSIILTIIFIGLGIWTIIEIVTHKSVIYEEPKQIPIIPTSQPILPTSQPILPTAQPILPIVQQPALVYNAQTTTTNLSEQPSTLSTSLSDIPVPTQERKQLTGELISLSGAMDQ